MDHEEIQAALSARLDGEPYPIADDILDAHVAACSQCREFEQQAARLSSSLRFVEAPRSSMSPPRDLPEAILAEVESQWRRTASSRRTLMSFARIALVILAIVHLLWAVTTVISSGPVAPVSDDGQLLAPEAQPEMLRLLVESAALRLALAVGCAFCAWQPKLVAGFSIVPATVTTFLIGFTARDFILGIVTQEQILLLVVLLLTVLALAVVWLVERGFYAQSLWRQLGADPA